MKENFFMADLSSYANNAKILVSWVPMHLMPEYFFFLDELSVLHNDKKKIRLDCGDFFCGF